MFEGLRALVGVAQVGLAFNPGALLLGIEELAQTFECGHLLPRVLPVIPAFDAACGVAQDVPEPDPPQPTTY